MMDMETVSLLKELGGWGVAILMVLRLAKWVRAVDRKLGTTEEHLRSMRASMSQMVFLLAVQAGMDPATIDARSKGDAHDGDGRHK